MADSDSNWRLWGERDPYYGVLTDARFRKRNIDTNRDDFFESGRTFVGHWLGEFERHFDALTRKRAMDFGCGVGRLTIPLSEYFDTVVGLDISPAMLEEARKNSTGRRIDYFVSDDMLSQVDGCFDFVSSLMVFQHIPVIRGMKILDKLLASVRSGGGCLVHVSTKRKHGWWNEVRYKVRHDVPGGQALMNLAGRKPWNTPVMQMNEYSIDSVLRIFRHHSFKDALVHFEDHGDMETAIVCSRRI